MRTSILVAIRVTVLPMVGALLFLGCSEAPTAVPPPSEGHVAGSGFSKQGRHAVADMNARFATEQTGANGFARVVQTQDGHLGIDRVKVKGLLPNHNDYVLQVTVDLTLAGQMVIASGPVTTDKHGTFLLDDFDLGAFAPGTYRVDVFITHSGHASGPGTGGAGSPCNEDQFGS